MIFDQYKDVYAHARITADHGYAHIDIHVYNLFDGWSSKPTLRITCQAGHGMGGTPHGETYGHDFGISHDFCCLGLHFAEQAVKVLRKVDRKLEREGYPKYGVTFATYATQILYAIGVERVFINEEWGGPIRNKLTDLPCYSATRKNERDDLLDALVRLERKVLAQYP